MARRLIIVTGYPGAGKSYTARLIVSGFPKIRSLSYDALKEAWWDLEGFDGEAEKFALNQRCLQAFWDQLGQAMSTGDDLLIEYPFAMKHVPALKKLLERYDYSPVTIVLAGDPGVLWERFTNRNSRSGRHPGHNCSTYHKGGKMVYAKPQSRESWERECREKNYYIHLGPQLVVDRTTFREKDDENIMRFLREKLAGREE